MQGADLRLGQPEHTEQDGIGVLAEPNVASQRANVERSDSIASSQITRD